MISSFALESTVAPKGVACIQSVSGYHRTDANGVCDWCSKATR